MYSLTTLAYFKVSEETIHGEIAEINRKSKACMISSLKGKGYVVRDKMPGSGRTISLVMRGEEICGKNTEGNSIQ